MERLQKYIAQCGVASRRKAETYILEGRVSLNGKIVNALGVKIDPEKDKVLIDGKEILKSDKLVYIMINKPEGCITSVKDQFDRPTVLDLVKNIDERLVPVGRLDYDTSGLLLLTNDGELTYKLTHPKHNIEKVYIAKVKGVPSAIQLHNFMNGLRIDDYVTSNAKIKILEKNMTSSKLRIVIHEGKNRQVRKMCSAIGHEVITLQRIQIDKLNLGDLKKSEYRNLTAEEVKDLYKSVID